MIRKGRHNLRFELERGVTEGHLDRPPGRRPLCFNFGARLITDFIRLGVRLRDDLVGLLPSLLQNVLGLFLACFYTLIAEPANQLLYTRGNVRKICHDLSSSFGQ